MLVLALVFLMVFGAWIGIVLQFAAAGQRTTVSIRAEATSTYAGGGALEGAINATRSALSVGTQAAGATTCFTLPVGALDNPTVVTVTCEPLAGSGSPVGGGSASQPDGSVLALSAATTEGVSVAAASVLPTQGDVLANKRITVPAGATLTSSGSVRGLTCSTAGTVSPACTVAAAGTATDPAWPGPSTAATLLLATLPACGTTVVALARHLPLGRRAADRAQLRLSGCVVPARHLLLRLPRRGDPRAHGRHRRRRRRRRGQRLDTGFDGSRGGAVPDRGLADDERV